MTKPDCFLNSSPKYCKDDYTTRDREDEENSKDLLKPKKQSSDLEDF